MKIKKLFPLLMIALFFNIGNIKAQIVGTWKKGASLKIEKSEVNLGTKKQGEKVSHVFEFINDGTEPLIIRKAKGSKSCPNIKYPEGPTKSGGAGKIEVICNIKTDGDVQEKIILSTNAQNSNIRKKGKFKLIIKAIVK